MDNPVLNTIMQYVTDDIEVSDEEYQEWEMWYNALPDYQRVENLLGVVSQFLTSPSKTTGNIMAIAIVCTNRWISNKELEDF